MRFDREKQTGGIILGSMIAYVVFIFVAAGIALKVYRETPPRYTLLFLLAASVIYMIVYLVRFIRLYRLWKGAFLEIGDDLIRGFGADEKLRHIKPFELPAQSMEDVALTSVYMTRKTPLNAVKLIANGETYLILGLEINDRLKQELLQETDKF